MVIITGDSHGNPAKFKESGIPELSSSDKVIILGGFGFDLRKSEAGAGPVLEALAGKKYDILFIDGNEELTHAALNQYPVSSYCGGKIHKISDGIIHLMRGQVYSIDGHSYFTFGGAASADRFYQGDKWSKYELPSVEEYAEGMINLRRHGDKVDYILTHTAPRHILAQLGHIPEAEELELDDYLEWIWKTIEFEKWFFGHFHLDKKINPKISAIWKNAVKIR